MGKRVASLLRLSTKKQASRQGDTEPDIPSQRQAVAEFLRDKPDWTHVVEFVETGVSAFRNSADDRDVLQEVMRAAKARNFDVLVLARSDRLSRKSHEYPGILADLNKYKVEVWSVADRRELSMLTQGDKLQRLLEGWQGETESVNTSMRVSLRMRQLAQEGRWAGSKVPFGFSLVARKDSNGEPVVKGGRLVRDLVPHPTNSAIVREVFRRYLAGEGYLKLADWLNRSGASTYTGALWSQKTVQDLIRNPLYAGLIVYARTQLIPGTDVRTSSTEPIYAKGTHEALVDESTWEQAQRLREARSAVPLRQRNATEYTLVGVLRCGVCGGAMGGHTRSFARKTGELVEYPVYRCLNHKASKSCPVTTYVAAPVEDGFLTAVEQLALPGGLREFLEQQDQENRRRVSDALESRRRAKERLGEIHTALSRLDKAYLEAGAFSDEEYKLKKQQYQAERRDLETELQEPMPSVETKDLEALSEAAKEIRANWPYMSIEERKCFALNLAQAYEVRVVVYPGAKVRLEPNGK